MVNSSSSPRQIKKTPQWLLCAIFTTVFHGLIILLQEGVWLSYSVHQQTIVWELGVYQGNVSKPFCLYWIEERKATGQKKVNIREGLPHHGKEVISACLSVPLSVFSGWQKNKWFCLPLWKRVQRKGITIFPVKQSFDALMVTDLGSLMRSCISAQQKIVWFAKESASLDATYRDIKVCYHNDAAGHKPSIKRYKWCNMFHSR